MNQSDLSAKTELLLKALANKAIEAQCSRCGAVEFIIEMDVPLDEVFLANYRCDGCERED